MTAYNKARHYCQQAGGLVSLARAGSVMFFGNRMESKLLKVKLQPNSNGKLLELIEYIKRKPNEPFSEMQQKGYFWDSFFMDGEDNLYMVLKSKDFSSIMQDEASLIETEFRSHYEKFRTECWQQASYQNIEEIFCFNKELSFLGIAHGT